MTSWKDVYEAERIATKELPLSFLTKPNILRTVSLFIKNANRSRYLNMLWIKMPNPSEHWLTVQ